MKIAVDEWENEDAAEAERSGVYELDDKVFDALSEYYKTGFVDPIIEKGVKKIEEKWFLEYDVRDGSQINHMVGLYTIANGVFLKYDGTDIKNRFSTTYTPSLSIEEIREDLKI